MTTPSTARAEPSDGARSGRGESTTRAAPARAARGTIEAMEHDPAPRRKRSKDPIRAAWEIFQEVIGEAPRTVPTCTEEKGGGRAATSPAGQKKIRKAPKP